MKTIPFLCPPNVFPSSFEGNIALGIVIDRSTLWLIFKVRKGSTVIVEGALSDEKVIPQEVVALKPVVVASAASDHWKRLVDDEEQFYERVADSKVHVGGDYRLFGRYSLSLLRAIQTTKLWEEIDEIVDGLRRDNPLDP